jgi:uroporphyrinogen-III synthase
MLPVLVLRPEPGASATARRARALGLAPVVAPLFVIGPRRWDAPPATSVDALMLTSANAVRHGGPALLRYADLPVFAVGSATADAARAAGFRTVHAGERDGQAVVAAMVASGIGCVLHLSGREVAAVDPRGIAITRVAVYAGDVLPAPDLPTDGVALIHSVRAARRFAAIVPQRVDQQLVAISAAVADAAGRGWAGVAVAATPDDAAMLALAQRLCQSGRND